MARYKLKGQRFLRKYTAANPTPVYAAKTDVQKIVDTLCDVPWEKVNEDSATMTYHTDDVIEEGAGWKITGLNKNVQIRNSFDAALFCANHAAGQHRAYANAAVYRYVLPDGATPRLTRLSCKVTSDPYNANGARISLLTNTTGIIPTNCNEVRAGDYHLAGVSPRTTRTVDKTDYWYPTTARATFAVGEPDGSEHYEQLPQDGLQLGKYLFLFVVMENYNTVRGNWIEGCSFLDGLVEIETDASVDGWTEDGVVDLTDADPDSSMDILRGGFLPTIPASFPTGYREHTVRTDAESVINADSSQTPVKGDATDAKAAAALGRLYAEFARGDGDMLMADIPGHVQTGASFNVTRLVEKHLSETNVPESFEVLKIRSQALVVPFSYPNAFVSRFLKIYHPGLNLPAGCRFNVFVKDGYHTGIDEAILKEPAHYDLIGNATGMVHLGSITSGDMTRIALPSTSSRAGTLVITGYLPPECYDLSLGGEQGTGGPFMPDIEITD